MKFDKLKPKSNLITAVAVEDGEVQLLGLDRIVIFLTLDDAAGPTSPSSAVRS